eukprot:TRINITY_DN215_c0_g1_i1.p1 TRINITY_DN215_c0_g1~~TRINITY_DN215_c0_g1_i1.p1  ORF type:complete len:243 (+),score=123.24 TRINITY_DN215_c0_g1_i1:98-730(+)
MSLNALLQGDLLKQGDKGPIKSWKRRFFVLKKGESVLHYYDGAKETGTIDLDLVTDIEIEFGEHFQFKIVSPSRTYYLRAQDDAQRSYWVDGLSKFLWPVEETVGQAVTGALGKIKKTAAKAKKAITGSVDDGFDGVSAKDKARMIAEAERAEALREEEKNQRAEAAALKKQAKDAKKTADQARSTEASLTAKAERREVKADKLKEKRKN